MMTVGGFILWTLVLVSLSSYAVNSNVTGASTVDVWIRDIAHYKIFAMYSRCKASEICVAVEL